MNLPKWAERAFAGFDPQTTPGERAPDPDRVDRFKALHDRFEWRWRELAPEDWSVPETAPFYARLQSERTEPLQEYLRQCILEVALECGWEHAPRLAAMKSKTGPSKKERAPLTRAISDLQLLNEQISSAAEDLAALFRQRAKLQEDFSLGDQHGSDDSHWPDAFDLAGALELTFKHSNFGALSSKRELLSRALGRNHRERATIEDLLNVISARTPRPAFTRRAADLAATGAMKTNSTQWSVLQHQLIDGLVNWGGLPVAFLLNCLSDAQLATLASVAFGAPADAYNDGQTRRLLCASGKRGLTPGRLPRKNPPESF